MRSQFPLPLLALLLIAQSAVSSSQAVSGLRIIEQRDQVSTVRFEQNADTELVYASTINPLYLAAVTYCLRGHGKDYFTTRLPAAGNQTLAEVAEPLLRRSSNEALINLRKIICAEGSHATGDSQYAADYVQAYLDRIPGVGSATKLTYSTRAKLAAPNDATPGFTSTLKALQTGYRFIFNPANTKVTGLTPAIIANMLQDMGENYKMLPQFEVKPALANMAQVATIS